MKNVKNMQKKARSPVIFPDGTRKFNTATSVIPGFGLSIGVTVTMLSFIVLIPLLSMFWSNSDLTLADFFATITRRRVLMSFAVSLETALIASLINMVMGLVMAWVLVRYEFPGKRLLDGMIELPFALPTVVAGMALTSLTTDNGLIGGFLERIGIGAPAYTRAGIVIAMIFVGIPFVVRSIQPVLEKVDRRAEEAAFIMGAGPACIFWRVIFPEIRPAMLVGFGLAFARSLGEYGSVVFIAGNQPYKTEIAPLLIMSELQEYDYASATAIALGMLIIAFFTLFVMNLIQSRAARRAGER